MNSSATHPSLVGAMLVIYGIVTGGDAELYKRSLDININLRWGLVLLVFGAWMLLMAWRGSKQPAEPQTSEKK